MAWDKHSFTDSARTAEPAEEDCSFPGIKGMHFYVQPCSHHKFLPEQLEIITKYS